MTEIKVKTPVLRHTIDRDEISDHLIDSVAPTEVRIKVVLFHLLDVLSHQEVVLLTHRDVHSLQDHNRVNRDLLYGEGFTLIPTLISRTLKWPVTNARRSELVQIRGPLTRHIQTVSVLSILCTVTSSVQLVGQQD